jgi:hypothetical protein
MKKGLAVMILISLALVASSCGIGNGTVIVLSGGDANDTGKSAVQNTGSITLSLKTAILTTPTVEELLDALLDVDAISSSTKDKITIILDLLPELEDWLAEIPDETWQAIDVIMGNVTELHTVDATTDALQDAIDSGEYDDYEYLPEALEFGIELLEDGKDDLYNPGWSPYEGDPFASYSFNVSQMMRAALEGGIAGAVGAALADFAPAQYVIGIGGCLGAVNSLIADMISQLSGYW